MRFFASERIFVVSVAGLILGLISSTWTIDTDGPRVSRKTNLIKSNANQTRNFSMKKIPCGANCSGTPVKRKIVLMPHSLDRKLPNSNSKMLIPFQDDFPLSATDGVERFKELTEAFREKRKSCRRQRIRKAGVSNFSCEKSKWISWFLAQLKKNSTDVFSSFVKLTPSTHLKAEDLGESELMPENWPEKFVFRIIEKFGEPTDKLFFHKFKEFTKSRDLQVTVPHLLNLQVSPRTHLETGRTFFDPGFNLKLKLPFFHDELKFAVSTGPSFLAGLGVGIIVLGIKSIFAPFVLAFKAYLLSWFFKDLSPFDFMKAVVGHGPPPVRHSPEAAYSQGWEQPSFEPPEVHNAYDYAPDKKSTPLGSISNMLTGSFFPSFDNSQYSNNPIIQHTPTSFNSPSYDGFGRNQFSKHSPNIADSDNGLRPPTGSDAHEIESEQDPTYVPSSALKQEVENFDPFYSPLLSRIDSIFMHLGFSEEGCKERAVCSIYKFPVKYAPYSNLLSAQLSKHQSELKRPVSTSPKILRYFKYMKAAKDGQASLNCIELYPKCTNDTEKLSSLPMVKTFQQLSELIGTGSGSG